ncbi:MAG: tetratricopeptide repeat protein [Chitinophagaceae bacterium]|nr:tetratricopeptide repeat protein [Chitinophagaceae bacterium]
MITAPGGDIHSCIGFAYRTLNKPVLLSKNYLKSIEVDPRNADAYVDLGHYYFSLSRGIQLLLIMKGLAIEPGNIYAGIIILASLF